MKDHIKYKGFKGNLNIRLSPELHKKAAHNDAIKQELASGDPDL